MPFLNMSGWRLYYDKVGEYSKECLVFVHGNAASGRWWDKIKPILPKKWSSYFVDLRGFGRSDNQKPYTIYQFQEDIKRFVENLNLIPFHFIGHSMGGVVGYSYAVNYQRDLKSLILVDAPPATGYPVDNTVRNNFRAMMENKSVLEAALRNATVAFLKDNRFFEDVVLKDALRSIPQAYTDIVEAVDSNNANFVNELPKLKIPVLFIHGEYDKVSDWLWMRETYNSVTNKKERVIENSSHSPMIENPEEFVAVLKEFIEEVRNNG